VKYKILRARAAIDGIPVVEGSRAQAQHVFDSTVAMLLRDRIQADQLDEAERRLGLWWDVHDAGLLPLMKALTRIDPWRLRAGLEERVKVWTDERRRSPMKLTDLRFSGTTMRRRRR
jgi:hypothetical protein